MRRLFPLSAPPGAPPPTLITPRWWYLAAPAALGASLWVGTWPLRAGGHLGVALGLTALLATAAGVGLAAVWQWRARAAIRAQSVTPTTPPAFAPGQLVALALSLPVLALLVLGLLWGIGAGRAI